MICILSLFHEHGRTLITDSDYLPYRHSHPTITLNDVKEDSDKSSTLVPLISANLLSNHANLTNVKETHVQTEDSYAIYALVSELVLLTLQNKSALIPQRGISPPASPCNQP